MFTQSNSNCPLLLVLKTLFLFLHLTPNLHFGFKPAAVDRQLSFGLTRRLASLSRFLFDSSQVSLSLPIRAQMFLTFTRREEVGKPLLRIRVTASAGSLQTDLCCSVCIDVLTCRTRPERFGIKTLSVETSIRFN